MPFSPSRQMSVYIETSTERNLFLLAPKKTPNLGRRETVSLTLEFLCKRRETGTVGLSVAACSSREHDQTRRDTHRAHGCRRAYLKKARLSNVRGKHCQMFSKASSTHLTKENLS